MTKYKYKMVVVVDSTVKMPKGKLAREVAGAVTHSIMYHFSYFKWLSLIAWYKGGMKTVVLKTEDMDELTNNLRLFGNFYISMIDAGLTVFKEQTRTCIVLPICKEEKSPVPVKDLKLL